MTRVHLGATGCAIFGCAVATVVQHLTGSEKDGSLAGLAATVVMACAVLAWRRWRRR